MTKLLALDGMGAPGIIWNSLVLPMQAKYPQLSPVYSEWENWQDYLPIDFDVICGHSLGGDSAVQFCNYLKAKSRPQPKLLMTLGARHQSAASWFDWFLPVSPVQNFTAPNSVTANFYTYGLLPSSPMTGAMENVNVTSLSIWHATIPSAPAVQACLEKYLEGVK